MKTKNFFIKNNNTNNKPLPYLPSNYLLIKSLEKKYEYLKISSKEDEFNSFFNSKKNELNIKIDNFIEILKNVLNEIENKKLIHIKYNKFAPKTNSFYKLFLDLPLEKEEIFKFHTIKLDYENDKKIFEFEILNKDLAKERIKDLLKILNKEDLLVTNNPKKFSEDLYAKLNLNSFSKKKLILNIKFLESIEEIKIINFYEIINLYNDFKFKSLEINNFQDTDEKIPKFDLNQISDYKIGVLDEKIHNNFLKSFSGLVDYKNLIKDEKEYLDFLENSHAEAVSSIVIMGDKINNVFDGNGIIKVKIFGILSKEKEKNSFEEVGKRIIKAIEGSPEIRIFVLSLGLDSFDKLPKQITPFGIFLDEISIKYNIRFITTGGNDISRTGKKIITPPADSELAITVNSLDKIDGEPASYSRNGYYGIYGNKPTLSFFGGDIINNNPIKVFDSGMIRKVEGTSLAAPWVARFYANIYFSKINNNLKEREFLEKYKHQYTEGILINDSIINTNIKYFNDLFGKNKNNFIGAGKLPLLKYNDSRRYISIFNKEIFKSRKIYVNNYIEKLIPLPKINNEYDYNVAITIVDIPKIDHKFGSDFILNTTYLKISIIKEDDSEIKETISKEKLKNSFLKPFTGSNYDFLNEESLCKKGKWKRLYTEKFYINDYAKKIKELDNLKINLNLRRTNRFDNIEEQIESIIIFEYELGESIEKDEFYNKLESLNELYKNESDLIEVPDIEVSDIET